MTILSYTQICDLLEDGVVENADPACVNSASLDIHLGDFILTENLDSLCDLKYLEKKSQLNMSKVDLREGSGEYCLAPGEFILAQSREIFRLPNDVSAEYKLKSSMARLGLDHLNAGWCDAGWYGSVLTLELKNLTRNHRIVIKRGDRIGQMIFFRHSPVPQEKSYATRGSYNQHKEVKGVETK